MLESAVDAGVEGARVLDLGGGLGTIGSELLAAGAAESEVVELVAAWEPYALELARERGLEERTSFTVVDILDRPDAVDPADIVILNRVVCCTPDGIALTGEAASHARRTLVLSFPRDVLWVRVLIRGLNAGMWVLRRSYRASSISPRPARGGRVRGAGCALAAAVVLRSSPPGVPAAAAVAGNPRPPEGTSRRYVLHSSSRQVGS